MIWFRSRKSGLVYDRWLLLQMTHVCLSGLHQRLVTKGRLRHHRNSWNRRQHARSCRLLLVHEDHCQCRLSHLSNSVLTVKSSLIYTVKAASLPRTDRSVVFGSLGPRESAPAIGSGAVQCAQHTDGLRDRPRNVRHPVAGLRGGEAAPPPSSVGVT